MVFVLYCFFLAIKVAKKSKPFLGGGEYNTVWSLGFLFFFLLNKKNKKPRPIGIQTKKKRKRQNHN
jgi:hypothetical protein